MKDAVSMYQLAKRLFPICRSLTGKGNRETLKLLSSVHPIKIQEVPTGTKVFDWEIPDEWSIEEAYIEDANGRRVLDFQENNLHVVGYSAPVDEIVDLEELKKHIYTLPEQPDVIPYVTSYYKPRFGFCMSHHQRESLPPGKYHMVIRSELRAGSLTYGEILLPGKSEKEIFLSTYICHPSMANNELSGPCVTVYLAKWLAAQQKRNYTYRIVFVPETIGSITYISRNLAHMKKNIIAGFNITCVGDDRAYSYLPSRRGDTLADRVAKNVLSFRHPEYIAYSYLDRGSDERQYCAPGVDLPVCSIMRSKYGEYPEYHTSADDLALISPAGLQGAYDIYRECLSILENNAHYKMTCLCEPQLGKRGLYPTESYKGSANTVHDMMNFIAYADGEQDLIQVGNKIGVCATDLLPIIRQLEKANLLVTI